MTVFAPPAHGPEVRLNTRASGISPIGSEVGEHGERVVRTRFRDHGVDLASRAMDQLVVSLDSVRLAWRKYRKDRPDVLISTAPSLPSTLAGWVTAKLLRVPHIAEMRDAWPDLIRDSNFLSSASLRRRVVARITRSLVARAQRKAAAVVVTTESFSRVLRERGVQRVVTIRNANWAAVPRAHDSSLTTGGGLRVLYTGTTGRSQGLDYAIRAAWLAERAGVRITLRVVGDGAMLKDLKVLARQIEAPVEFLGHVPISEVPRHQDWADTLLVSLISWRPFEWTVPSKLYEAFAVGKHVSAALQGEGAQLVANFGAGHVVPPSNSEALAELWQGLAADRRKLEVSNDASLWVEQELTSERLAAAYFRLFDEVLALK